MSEEIEELRKQYSGTVISFRSKRGKNLPFSVSDVTHIEGEEVYFHGKVLGQERWRTHPPVPMSEVDLRWPLMGLVNLKNGATAFLERRVSRQWKKGLRLDHVHTTYVVYSTLRNLGGRHIKRTDSFDLLFPLFNREYPNPEQALREVTDMERISSAFSEDLWFSNHFLREEIILGYKHSPIGYVRDGRIIVDRRVEPLKEVLEGHLGRVSFQ